MSKETYMHNTSPGSIITDTIVHTVRLVHIKETYVCQKRPVYVKRDLCMTKETYV